MQKKRWFIRGAPLALALVLLAGCGGEAAQPTPNSNTQTQGGAGDGASTPMVAPAALTPGSGNVVGADTSKWLDLKTIDACGLLSEAEVRSLMPNVEFRQSPSGYEHSSDAAFGPAGAAESDCTFADTQLKGYLRVNVYTPNRWDLGLSIRPLKPEPVAGFGDEAFIGGGIGGQAIVVLLRDRAALEVIVNPTYTSDGKYDPKQAREIAMKFAQIIIPRLR